MGARVTIASDTGQAAGGFLGARRVVQGAQGVRDGFAEGQGDAPGGGRGAAADAARMRVAQLGG